MIRQLPIAFIRFYQTWLSPLLPPACIYQPSCSQYAIEAIQSYGAIRGCWMGAARLLRCHPFARGGYDPVPLPPGKQLTETKPELHRATCCPHHPPDDQ